MKLKWIFFVGVVVGENNLPSLGNLRYDRFKKNLKCNNFIYPMLNELSDNVEVNILSSLINVCHYIAECYEDEFVSTASN